MTARRRRRAGPKARKGVMRERVLAVQEATGWGCRRIATRLRLCHTTVAYHLRVAKRDPQLALVGREDILATLAPLP
jgi:DNA-binding NarL/FixJ family response regulator